MKHALFGPLIMTCIVAFPLLFAQLTLIRKTGEYILIMIIVSYFITVVIFIPLLALTRQDLNIFHWINSYYSNNKLKKFHQEINNQQQQHDEHTIVPSNQNQNYTLLRQEHEEMKMDSPRRRRFNSSDSNDTINTHNHNNKTMENDLSEIGLRNPNLIIETNFSLNSDIENDIEQQTQQSHSQSIVKSPTKLQLQSQSNESDTSQSVTYIISRNNSPLNPNSIDIISQLSPKNDSPKKQQGPPDINEIKHDYEILSRHPLSTPMPISTIRMKSPKNNKNKMKKSLKNSTKEIINKELEEDELFEIGKKEAKINDYYLSIFDFNDTSDDFINGMDMDYPDSIPDSNQFESNNNKNQNSEKETDCYYDSTAVKSMKITTNNSESDLLKPILKSPINKQPTSNENRVTFAENKFDHNTTMKSMNINNHKRRPTKKSFFIDDNENENENENEQNEKVISNVKSTDNVTVTKSPTTSITSTQSLKSPRTLKESIPESRRVVSTKKSYDPIVAEKRRVVSTGRSIESDNINSNTTSSVIPDVQSMQVEHNRQLKAIEEIERLENRLKQIKLRRQQSAIKSLTTTNTTNTTTDHKETKDSL